MSRRCSLVGRVFIGGQTYLQPFPITDQVREHAVELEKRLLNTLWIGSEALLELFSAPFLLIGHPAFASQGDIVEPVEKLRLIACKQVEVTGEVLTDGEALETVCCEVF